MHFSSEPITTQRFVVPLRLKSVGVVCLLTLLGLVSCSSAMAAHRLVLQGKGRLAIVDSNGNLQWEMPWGGIHDIHVR